MDRGDGGCFFYALLVTCQFPSSLFCLVSLIRFYSSYEMLSHISSPLPRKEKERREKREMKEKGWRELNTLPRKYKSSRESS